MRLLTILLTLATLVLVLPLGLHAGAISTTTLTNQQSFDFDTLTFGFLTGGDLYYLSQDCATCNAADKDKFWANNAGQQGLLDVGAVALLSISSIPATSYSRSGVPDVVGHSYISLAQTGESGNYIFFQVTGKTTSSVTFNWIYGSSAPATVPEPASCFLLVSGLGGLTVALWRGKRFSKQ